MSNNGKAPNGGATNGSKAAIDRSAQKEADAFAARITASWQKAVESIIETGRLLIEAKKELPHGEFMGMFTIKGLHSGKVPFGPRTAQMLMLIAKHPVLSDAKYISHLPPSWGTLYELTTLPPSHLHDMIEKGQITPDTQRSDVRTLSFELCHKVPEALGTLIHFMWKWDPNELAEHVAGPMYVNWVINDMDALVPWLQKLYAACKKHSIEARGQTEQEWEEEHQAEQREDVASEKDLLERRKKRLKTRRARRNRLAMTEMKTDQGNDERAKEI